jgi:BirA family biotin operon repressor/biotin-[acetyl-CoA-carboxylase] ligase
VLLRHAALPRHDAGAEALTAMDQPYRPSAPGRALNWATEDLWQQLRPLLPGISVEVVARCGSTNTVLVERARESSGWRDQPVSGPIPLDPPPMPPTGAPVAHGRRAGDTQPCLLVAEHQTRGRGRLGRAWHASPGASLTFSLSAPLAPADWAGLSLVVGCAIADALDPPLRGVPPAIGLKWPNDLWLVDGPGRGRKLAGILIETVAVGGIRMAVIGVGVNIVPQALDDASSGYACLQELQPEAAAPGALHRIAPALARAVVRFEREGFAAFADAYARRDLLRGQRVATSGAGVAEGVALGVSASGALIVRTDDGVQHEIVGGEVSARPQPRDGA